MAKLMALFGALLLSGSLDVSSGAGAIAQEVLYMPEPTGAEAYASTDVGDVDAQQPLSDSTAPVSMGEMSEDEKERRRSVCDKQYYNCRDKCDRYFPKKPKERARCKDDCWDDYVECLKPIS